MEQINDAQRTLMALLGKSLFGREFCVPMEADWRSVLREAEAQAVLPLAWDAAKSYFNGPEADAIEETVNNLVVNNLYMDFDHVQLHETMTAAGISYVVMKGSSSASYYPKPLLRMMGDLDFLVSAKNVDRAAEALLALGFREIKEQNHPVHRAFVRDTELTHRSEWELHWQPNGIPNNAAGNQIQGLLADSIETAQLHETENGSYRIPDAFHHGLMILIHTARHMTHSGIGLRHLCDWAVFSSHFDREEFCDLFEEKLLAVGLWNFAAALTAVSVRYLGCPDPGWQGSMDPDFTEELMCDILTGGNFGQKDRGRLNEAKLMVDHEKRTVHPGAALSNLISALNVKTRRRWPVTGRVPLLLPLGWIPVGVRHMLGILRGKRPKIYLKKTLKQARERGALYDRLGLYQEK